jgi:hypothetical protein
MPFGGKAIDDLAEVVDDGGTIINFGSFGSNMGTNIYSLAPNNVALRSVSIMSWFRLTQDEKQKDFELALSLATNHPEPFEGAHEYLILLSCGPPDSRQSSIPCGL